MSKTALLESIPQSRQIRSFVRREGRATPAQKKAMHKLWPIYGFEPELRPDIDPIALFGRDAPLVLEIGFGDGEALIEAAMREKEHNFIGAEVYTPGVGHCLLRIDEQGISNVQLCQFDAIDLLRNHLLDKTLNEVRLFFPDPWPKKKHHKRRIVNADFVNLLCQKLKMGGRIHFATDWQDYAQSALNEFEACPCLRNSHGSEQFAPRSTTRPVTKFERRGLRLGHGVWDMIFTKVR